MSEPGPSTAGEVAGAGSTLVPTRHPAAAAPLPTLETAADWLRKNAIVVTGVLLIAAQIWWKSGLLAHSFFRLDDYVFLQRASVNGLTWKYLMWVDAGHLTPIGFLIAWFLVRISPGDWALTSAVTLLLLAGACLALLRMLRVMFGDHPGVLVLLLIYLVSPLSFSGTSWWTVTLEQLPLQIALFCAVAAHIRYLRTGQRKHAIAAAVWLAVGMASSFKSAAVPLLLFALTSAYFVGGSWPRAAWAVLRSRWRLWLGYGGIVAGYLIAYAAALSTSSVSPGRPGEFSSVFGFITTLIKDTFIPGMFGGPWRWLGTGVGAGASAPPGLARMSWVLAALLILISLWFSPRAWRAWTMLIGWLVVVDITPVLLGRASFLPGPLLGLVTRYVWDALAVLVLCLGLAFLPVVGASYDRGAWRHFSRPLRTISASVLTAFVIGSLWSFYNYPVDPGVALGRAYVATGRIALAQAPHGTAIVDDPVPQGVFGSFVFGPWYASGVLGPLVAGQPGRPRFVSRPYGTYDHLLEFDGWGRLVPSIVVGAGSLPLARHQACWPVRAGRITIRLGGTTANATTVRLGYIAGTASNVLVEFGGSADPYQVQRGFHAAFLPVQGSGAVITVVGLSGPLPCIGDAQAGVLLPSTTGTPIPQLAVSG